MHSNGNFDLCCIDMTCNSISDCPKEWYEIYFVFACVWAFGAAMFQDQVPELLDFHTEQNVYF
jgi:dynein heavy chain